jgi:ligand-binding sensor domain-containing protein
VGWTLALVAFAGLLPWAAAPQAAPRAVMPPVGRWRTYANGDDVLALALQGNVVWSGTRAGGLVRWESGQPGYRQLLRPQDPLAGNSVRDIAIDGQGRKWLATDGGLTMLDDRGTAASADDLWRSYTRAGTNGALPSDDVRAVVVDGTRVWVGTAQVHDLATDAWSGGGLGMLDTKGTERTDDDTWAAPASFESTIRRNLDGTSVLGLVSDNILDLARTPAGNLWVATEPHWKKEPPADPNQAPVWTLVHGGLSFRDTRGTPDPADDRWSPVSCETMQFTVTCSVRALAIDAGGYAWAAIGGRGVMYFRADDPVIVDERTRRYDMADGLADNFVESIAFGPPGDPALKNTVWLGTRDGGISVLDHHGTLRDHQDDEWDQGRGHALSTADGLARNRVEALLLGADGLWLGTGPRDGQGGGVQRLDPTSGAVTAPLVTDQSPPSNFVTDLDFGRPGSRWVGHVWVATGSRAAAARRFGVGLADLDTAGTRDAGDDRWRQYRSAGTDDDGQLPWSGLAGDNVHAVALAGDRVWAGSAETVWDPAKGRYADGGLSLFDGSAWTARRVDNTGSPAGLPDGTVSALARGCGGELWAATGNVADNTGGGLVALTVTGDGRDRAGDHWQAWRYPELPSNNILDLSVDCGAGKVWLAAGHHFENNKWDGGGAAVRDIPSGRWDKYDTTNGLESYRDASPGVRIDAEARSVLAGANGTAWVGTYGTRLTKTTDLVTSWPYVPAVVNRFGAPGWQADVLAGAGWVSSIARDTDGRLWFATSRGGTARDGAEPENWRTDRAVPAPPTATATPTPRTTATPTRTASGSPGPSRTPTAVPPREQAARGGGLFVQDGATWTRLAADSSGIPANDLSVVAVGPDGDVWVGSEGWGLARLELGADPPTPTVTPDAPTPTATLTPTELPTLTPESTSTTGSPAPTSRTPTATSRTPRTPTATSRTPSRPPRKIYLALVVKPIGTRPAGRPGP